jgi:hypothetical protein
MKTVPSLLILIWLCSFAAGLVNDSHSHFLHSPQHNHKTSAGSNRNGRPTSPADNVQIAGLYDPGETATAEAWTKYKEKCAFLTCLLVMTDEDAGKAWPENGNPKSASSEWQGTLESMSTALHSLRLFQLRTDVQVSSPSGHGGRTRKLKTLNTRRVADSEIESQV